MNYYRRNLPHWQPKGAEYFITFRLAGTLPKSSVKNLKDQQNQFKRFCQKSTLSNEEILQFHNKLFIFYDNLLDKRSTGPTWLKDSVIAKTVSDALLFYHEIRYDLYAYTIMSNHVHVIFKHLHDNYDVDLPVTKIMKSVKSYTAKQANKILHRQGKFWQRESFDRVIRDESELDSKIRYTVNNPVKAGIVHNWKDHPYTYCKDEFIENL